MELNSKEANENFLSHVKNFVLKIRDITLSSKFFHRNSFLTCKRNITSSVCCASTFVLPHYPQPRFEMSQKTIDVSSAEPKPVTNKFGAKIIGVEIGKKETSNKVRVLDSSDNDDEPNMFLNPKPPRMVIPDGIASKRTKSTINKKKLSYGNFSTTKKLSFVHVHNTTKFVSTNEEYVSYPTKKSVGHVETIFKDSHVESHAETLVDSPIE